MIISKFYHRLSLHLFVNSNWFQIEINCIPITAIRPWNATCEGGHARPYRKRCVLPLPPMNTAADKECIRTSVDQQNKNCKKTGFINLERYMTNSWWIQHLCRSAHSAKCAEGFLFSFSFSFSFCFPCAEGFRSAAAEMRTKVPYSLRRLRVPAKSKPD